MKRPFGRGPTTPGLGWPNYDPPSGVGCPHLIFFAASLGGPIHTAGCFVDLPKKDGQKQKLGPSGKNQRNMGIMREMPGKECKFHLPPHGRWVGTCVFLRNMFTGSVETRTSSSNWEKQQYQILNLIWFLGCANRDEQMSHGWSFLIKWRALWIATRRGWFQPTSDNLIAKGISFSHIAILFFLSWPKDANCNCRRRSCGNCSKAPWPQESTMREKIKNIAYILWNAGSLERIIVFLV